MSYSALEDIMKGKALLYDEIKMWLRLGMYITTDASFQGSLQKSCLYLYDGTGNKWPIPETMGKNLRMQILKWWEVERVKPRAQEPVDNSGLGELENRSA